MIKANIYDKELIIDNFAIADGVKFDAIEFSFPEDWKGYEKTVVFKTDDGVTLNVILDGNNPLCISENKCFIPHEILKGDCFHISVFGIKGESVATTTEAKVNVLKSGYKEGENPSEPTQTEYQQLINLAAETKAIAQSVRDDADNGVFKGDKGDKGDDGNDVLCDHTYSPTSKNAQSGLAVAEAVANKMDSFGEVSKSQVGEGQFVYKINNYEMNWDTYIMSFANCFKCLVPRPSSDDTAVNLGYLKEYVNSAIGNALEGDY